MNKVSDSSTGSSFETLNNMMVLLESSLFDVQMMMSHAVETLFEVMGIEEAEISFSVPFTTVKETLTVSLEKVYYREEDELLMISAEGGREIPWDELDVSTRFEVVSQIHQKYVARYNLASMNREGDLH